MSETFKEPVSSSERMQEDERALVAEELGAEAVEDTVFGHGLQEAADRINNLAPVPPVHSEKEASQEVDAEVQKKVVLEKLATIFEGDTAQMEIFKERLAEVKVVHDTDPGEEFTGGFKREAYYLKGEVVLGDGVFSSPDVFHHRTIHELIHAVADDGEFSELLRYDWLTESVTEGLAISASGATGPKDMSERYGESDNTVYHEQRDITQLLLGGLDGKQNDIMQPLADKAYLARGFEANKFYGGLRDVWGISAVLYKFNKVLTNEMAAQGLIIKGGNHEIQSNALAQIVEKYKHDRHGLLSQMRRIEIA